MDLSKALLCLCVGLAPVTLTWAQPSPVTETKWVDYRNNRELLRKINGRWWSQDNREVYPPSKGGIFWQLDSKPGVCQFFHHKPFRLDRAESLHLWMTQDEVKVALGPPNRTLGTDDHGFWYYYAADGTKLTVRFMGEGVLGEASYDAIGEKSWPVASIEREMNGRSIYKLLQERAASQSSAWHGETRRSIPANFAKPRSRSGQPAMVTVESVPVSQPPELTQTRRLSKELLAGITLGATRQDVLNLLGDPAFRSTISGDEGTRESFTYHLDTKEDAVIRLVDGKVVKVR